MNMGFRQELGADTLLIYDPNGDVVASKDYDRATGLIKMDTDCIEVNSAMTVPNLRTRFGHLSGGILRKIMRQYKLLSRKIPSLVTWARQESRARTTSYSSIDSWRIPIFRNMFYCVFDCRNLVNTSAIFSV